MSAGWYALDLPNFIIHVMSTEARERYDLESLWGIGDENDEDDSPLMKNLDDEFLPPPREKL